MDQNQDGIDDIIADKTALTYGNNMDQYFNMVLVSIKILSIQENPNDHPLSSG